MTTPPSSPYPGQAGGWNQPPAGSGYQPTQIGHPDHGPSPHGRAGSAQPGYGAAQPGYGQAPYGQDPYGQAAGYGQAGGYGQGGYPTPGLPPSPPPKPGTNGFAIAALIFGIVGGVLLGVVFGFVALSQIKKSGQGGRGLALAGLILSGLWIVLIIIVLIVAVSTSAKRDTTGTVTQGGDITATSLQVGDCVNNLRDTTNLLSLPAVPCSQPHEGEVFAVFNLPAGPYPGAEAVDKAVNDECSGRFAAYAPNPTDPNPGLFSVYPLQQNWERGDREVACIATPGGGGRSTGSIKGS